MLMEIHTIESICLNYGPVIFYRQGRFFWGKITRFSGGNGGDQSSPTEYKEE